MTHTLSQHNPKQLKTGVEAPNDVPALCQAHLRYDCPVFEKILRGDE
jgi:hypothetical protein